MATVIVDAENVRRSVWPNIGRQELVALCDAWAAAREHDALVVFESAGETADDWIARNAVDHRPYWLVTSDRELRGGGTDAAARPD